MMSSTKSHSHENINNNPNQSENNNQNNKILPMQPYTFDNHEIDVEETTTSPNKEFD